MMSIALHRFAVLASTLRQGFALAPKNNRA